MARFFLDCDGVLADFEKKAEEIFGIPAREYEARHGTGNFYKKLHAQKDFFNSLDLLPDAMELYNAVKHLNPIILTGYPPEMEGSPWQKFEWVARHFGPDQRIITTLSSQKSHYCQAGDVIVDDWPKHREKWEKRGGIWIPHTSAKDSIEQLKNLGII